MKKYVKLTLCGLAALAVVTGCSKKEESAAETTAAETTAAETRAEITDFGKLVKLGTYKGVEVTKMDTTVTDEDVDNQIEKILAANPEYIAVTDRAAQNGDRLDIDFVGKLDGEAFDGGTSKGYDLEIGSGTFIAGFEDGLIGVGIGETVDLPLTFPENYTAELAGKDVIFTVTVNEVKRMKELTDELINEVTEGEYADLASYKENVRTMLEENAAVTRENAIKTEILTQIASNSEITEYPQEMVDYSVADMTNYYESYAAMYGMEFAEFLNAYFGLSEEEFAEQAVTVVKQNLQQELYVKAIAETEGIEIDDEEYAAGCQKYMDDYGFESVEALVEAIGGEETMRLSLLLDETYEYLLENSIVEDLVESGVEAETEAVTE